MPEVHAPLRPLAECVAKVEREALGRTPERCAGNLSAAARALAIDRNTLERELDKYGLR